MNISRMSISAALAIVALNVWAAPSTAPASAGSKPKFDATGTWKAKIESEHEPAVEMVFVLIQDKNTLTGTVSTAGAPPVEITDGKARRTTVEFSVSKTMPARTMPGQPTGGPAPKPMVVVTKYTGQVSGDEMIVTSAVAMPGMGGGMPMGGGGGGGMGGRGGGGMGGGGGGMGGPPPGGGGMGGGGGGMGGPPPGGGSMGGGMGGMKTTFTAKRQ